MQTLYFLLAALHMVAIVVTGILWTLLDLGTGLNCAPTCETSGQCILARCIWCRGSSVWHTPSTNCRFLRCIKSFFLPGWVRWSSSPGRLPVSPTTGIGAVLLLDPWLGDGAVLARSGLSGRDAALDGGGLGHLFPERLSYRKGGATKGSALKRSRKTVLP
jgi:hypothetical protein